MEWNSPLHSPMSGYAANPRMAWMRRSRWLEMHMNRIVDKTRDLNAPGAVALGVPGGVHNPLHKAQTGHPGARVPAPRLQLPPGGRWVHASPFEPSPPPDPGKQAPPTGAQPAGPPPPPDKPGVWVQQRPGWVPGDPPARAPGWNPGPLSPGSPSTLGRRTTAGARAVGWETPKPPELEREHVLGSGESGTTWLDLAVEEVQNQTVQLRCVGRERAGCCHRRR